MGAGVRLAVSLLAWVCLGAWSGEAWAGQLAVTPDKIEFGTLKEGVVAQKVVSLKNTGQELMSIKNVSTS